MAYVFLSGLLGFVVFDAYRIRKMYDESGVLALTGGTVLVVFVHVSVYLAAGALAIFVNLDVLTRYFGWQLFPHVSGDIVGPLLRGFGLGLAGPAGLSQTSKGDSRAGKNRERDLGDLGADGGIGKEIGAALNLFLMRR